MLISQEKQMNKIKLRYVKGERKTYWQFKPKLLKETIYNKNPN